MLIAKQIRYKYSGSSVLTFPDIEIPQGKHALILGKSGCGKTTLLHILAGILAPTQGSVFLDGKELYKLNESQRDAFRGKEIGLIFQTPHFIEALTVNENLLLAQSLGTGTKNQDKISDILEDLGMKHKQHAYPKNLSQGQKQRVSIARALVNSPQLILADEPTSALDDDNCSAVVKLLKTQAQKQNASLLIVTHDNRLSNLFETKIRL